ncbi:MAG: hypothetical protein OXG94_09770 [Bacteroidetes bacterium]|nr:hypothetical protein [Bacteroidota bacterium]
MQWLHPTMLWLALCATILMIPPAAQGQDTGDTALTVTPAFAWISESSPYGDVRLTNPGTRSVEVLFDLAYGVIEANQDGSGNIIRMDTSRVEGNLTEHLTIFPPRMVIPPGETQLMRYAVDLTTLPDGGYTTILLCSIAPRALVNPEQIPDPASTIQIHFTMSVPLILQKGIGAPQISARILERKFPPFRFIGGTIFP